MSLVTVDISSYDAFRNATLGNGYDVDNSHGYQCWDLGAELWGNTGNYVYPYLSTGGTGYAYGIWSARIQNAGNDFTLITSVTDVKRGDMLVLDRGRFAGDDSGHNGFADEDYNGTNTISMLGQNQVNPNPTTGHVTTIDPMDITKFLGAFRYNAWFTPPTPIVVRNTHSKSKFPWVIYSRKLRERHKSL